jgi:hypothetical protein
MKKTTIFTAILVTFWSIGAMGNSTDFSSENLESSLEREMLNSIEYVEECEEVDLGFDPYFHLPLGFNAYEGMGIVLKDIEYIELDED